MNIGSYQRVLITGAAGFVGGNIVQELSGKYEILAPSREDLDLQDETSVERYFQEHNIDVVIHCANLGGDKKTSHLTNIVPYNLRMFWNVVRCKKFFKKMIFLGSGAEYDKRRELHVISEDEFDQRVPADDYGFYKYSCSKYIEQSDNILNLRIFGLFGQREDYEIKFISNAICRTLLGLPTVIYQNVVFEYLYISDFVRIVDYCIAHEIPEKFINVGRAQPIDLLTIAKKVRDLGGRKTDILIQQPGLYREYTCNTGRLRSVMPEFVPMDFDASLRELYAWYEEHKNLIDPSKLPTPAGLIYQKA